MQPSIPPATDSTARPRRRTRGITARILRLATFLLVAYLGISVAVALVLTTPRRTFGPQTPADSGLAYRDVSFPARGGDATISAWYLPAANTDKAVVLVHGKDCSRTCWFGAGMAGLPQALQRSGLAVLALDLRGHGHSSDARFTFGLLERRDVLGAVDWLQSQGFAPQSIGVLGQSLGAAASIGALADDPQIGALVEDCGYADIASLISANWTQTSGLPRMFLPSSLLMARLLVGYDVAASRPVDEIARIAPRPVLIIHGTADTLIPVAHARRLRAALPAAAYWEVPGAGHAQAYPAAPQAYAERVTAFFAASLR